MDSKGLREAITEFIKDYDEHKETEFDQYPEFIAVDMIMRILSKNCYLKDTPTGKGKKIFELVRPIEVDIE